VCTIDSTIDIACIPSYLKKTEDAGNGKFLMGYSLGDACDKEAIEEKGKKGIPKTPIVELTTAGQ
jgi:hypothetical protein